MTTIQSFSKEVLVLVLTSLGSLESIAECRLVCKSWNDAAAIAMFERPLHLCFFNKARANKLIQYLTTNPKMGQHVKFLSVCHYNEDLLKAALPILFTPNIRELDDDNARDNLYQLVTKIAQESTIKFEKLTVIPTSFYFTDSYSAALWTFRETLTSLDITLQEIPDSPTHLINQLCEFKRLTMLTLDAPFDNVADLERMIGGCLQLEHLYLSTWKKIVYDDTSLNDATTATTTTHPNFQFDSSSIQQVNCLNTLSIVSAGYPHFVSYLLHKYPNTESIALNTYQTDAYMTKYSKHLIQIVSRVVDSSLVYRLPAGNGTIPTICSAAKGDLNIVNIGYHHDIPDTSTFIMTIEKRLSQQQESVHAETTFSIHIPPHANTMTHDSYLSQINIPIDSLEIDMFNYRDFDIKNDSYKRIAVSDEVFVIFNVLFDYPALENIRFIARDITNCYQSCFFQHHTQLKSLEICGALLSRSTFVALSNLCRELRVLTLINCPILPSKDGIARIKMEHTSFQQFTFQLKWFDYFTCITDDSNNNAAIEYAEKTLLAIESFYAGDTYLWLQTKKTKRALYLKIMPNDRYRYLISKKQFHSRPPEARAIQFSCFDVEHFVLDLESLQIRIDQEFLKEALNCRFSSKYKSSR